MSKERSRREPSPQPAAKVRAPSALSALSGPTGARHSAADVPAEPRHVEFTQREWAFGEPDKGVL